MSGIDLDALVADGGFEWVAGMHTRRGLCVVLVGLNSERLELSDGYGIESDDVPDLDNPATQGCFEHQLIPAAWGRGHIQTHWTSEGDGSIYIHDADGDEVWCIEMVPKAEALAAALLAAPAKDGGS